jgi:hypothetical protein
MRDPDIDSNGPAAKALNDRLAAALCEIAAVRPSQLTPNVRLLDDLGVYGDDWDEFLRRIPEAQETDWTGFNYSDYFDPEVSVIHYLRRLSRLRRRPLTLAHVSAVLLRRKWFEP